MAEAQQPVFSIEKVYVKDLSLEVPNAPQVFLRSEAPQLEVQLASASQHVDGALFETTVSVTVTAKVGDKTMFLVEAVQAGLFQIAGIPEGELPAVLGIVCPNVLFPYAREAISDTVNRAGFPPVLLAPVNFEAIYQQQVANAQQASGGAGQAGGPRIEIAH
ncbi:MAG: protein-export chaperone SecB [Betaproteobacteria bacterium]|nr:protein-export chaperone SecB [Betaproteobacteria bacterium]